MTPTPVGPSALSGRIAATLALDARGPFLEFHGQWRTWGQLAATADAVAAQVPAPGTRVGVLLRNQPAHVGLLVGLLRAGACVVTINPSRGVDRVRADLAGLGLPILAGTPQDVATFADDGGPRLVLTTTDLGEPVTASGELPADLGAARPQVAVEMLTSGTTGPPKRIPLGYEMLTRGLVGAKHYESSRDDTPRLRSGVAIVNAPLVHMGGLFRILQCLYDGRALCLLERFAVDDWADAVRRHKPRTVSLVPTALRMVLEADLDPAVFATVRSAISGTAPLSPDDADAFEAKYGVPVLVSYAATEFGGGVAGWNLADHQAHWSAKRGSVGRAHAGVELRVVDAEDFAPLPPDSEGLLEVRAHQFGDGADWVRTTDLARLDADGFLWILGRADQAIIRGGFKIRPEDVRTVLERDPRVRGAAVVGRPDPRLGAVPVAAVELRTPVDDVEATKVVEDLRAGAARVLAGYELPTEIRVLDALPRTPSGKVDLGAVKELLATPVTDQET
ncbi:class I adenylate-forming enzyme family protein [Pseudofrankia inefficax]|uniref:AMP-dependent synthetase and ligase n=1 Tax=Pseudofrankia inefficax (strain DSM 45817 / CECT 9037 / DDB 130130 / EuI1c) TaxID=298654 RepID=E3JBZ5_PSEI1|nr:AMP-binding protein [Pseudofrankia inefficax]ADP82305.1 AMP-dependent synthetase and ligase [Pseudofrankia inefficax]